MMKLNARGKQISLDEPQVMGIVNLTADSFSGDGVLDIETAVQQAQAMLVQGAAIIDLGAESSRPGATTVPVDVELARVVPVVEQLAKLTDAIISVDTVKPAVAEAALKAGAHIINDISGLRTAGMAEVVAKYGAGVVIMHMQGTPATMQLDPHYSDVVAEVEDFFQRQLAVARAAGIADDHILLDPGIGFGKTLEHNLALLRACGHFREKFHQPLLVGASRKGMIAKLTGREAPESRLYGTVALTAYVVGQGANVVRVHDVAANLDAVRVVFALAAA